MHQPQHFEQMVFARHKHNINQTVFCQDNKKATQLEKNDKEIK